MISLLLQSARHGLSSLSAEALGEVCKQVNDEVLPRLLGLFENMLLKRHYPSDGDWLVAGVNPTIADFFVVPRLQQLQGGNTPGVDGKALFAKFPLLCQYMKSFYSIPSVMNYYKAKDNS
jgi:hypothetical protein